MLCHSTPMNYLVDFNIPRSRITALVSAFRNLGKISRVNTANVNNSDDAATDLGFATAAFPVFTFTLLVILRRAAEVIGYAPNLGVLLVLSTAAVVVVTLATADRAQRGAYAGIVLFLVGVATTTALVFRKIPDNGFDAQAYHLPSVLRLLNGWKPMIEATDLMMANHQPSGMWTLLAGFDCIFGFESGRAVVPILMLAAGGAVWTMLRRIGMAVAPRVVVTILLIANPVAVSQIFTAFADGALYELTLILICSLLMMLDDRRLAPAMLAAATMILVFNTKLAGLLFAPLAVATWGSLLLLRFGSALPLRIGSTVTFMRERRLQIAMLVVASVLAVGFAGWRPYVVNVLEYHRLIYPPPDELGFKPNTGKELPENLKAAGRISKLAALFFAQTNMDGGPVTFKVPGAVASHELRMATDTRNGGFGPFSGATTLAALAALAWATARRTRAGTSNRHRIEVLLGLTAYGFVATILFPEPWWARFVPLAWLIPIGAVCLADTLRASVFVRSCAILCMALSTLNAAIAGNSAVRDAVNSATDIDQKLERMVSAPGPVYLSRGTVWNARIGGQHAAEEVWRKRIWDRGKTAVVIVPRAECQKSEFLSVDVERCAPPKSAP